MLAIVNNDELCLLYQEEMWKKLFGSSSLTKTGEKDPAAHKSCLHENH